MLLNLPISVKRALLALVVVGAIILPVVGSNYIVRVSALILVMTVFAVGLNLILGFTGLLSFGQAALFGIGAYLTARLLLDHNYQLILVLVLSVLASGIVGALIGLSSWRVGGDYLALITLGFGEVFYLYINNAKDVTGAATGLPGIPWGNFFGWELKSIQSIYIFTLIITVLVMVFARIVATSFFGRSLLAIREDEVVARAHGINVPMTKVVVFGLGSAIAGLAGALEVLLLRFAGPATFDLGMSILVVEIVLIGGMATTAGPLLGSILVIGSTELLRPIAEYRQLIFGALIIVILIWKPGGLTQILGLGGNSGGAFKSPLELLKNRRGTSKQTQPTGSEVES